MSAVLAVSLFPIGQQWAMRAGNNADLYPEKISTLILLNSLYRQIRNRTNGSHQSTPRRSHGQLLLSRSSRMLIFDNPDYERIADQPDTLMSARRLQGLHPAVGHFPSLVGEALQTVKANRDS